MTPNLSRFGEGEEVNDVQTRRTGHCMHQNNSIPVTALKMNQWSIHQELFKSVLASA
jgi:hypothetical protein